MKRYLQHILTLSLLLIIPTAHSFVYGKVRIKREYNNNYYYIATRSGSSANRTWTPCEFDNVASAINFSGYNSTTLYYEGTNTSVTKSLQENDIIEIKSNDTNETSTITINKPGIQIISGDDSQHTIKAADNINISNNCLLYINGGSVTINGTITLDANASNLNNAQRSVVRLAGTSPSLTLNGTLTGGNTTGNSSLGGGITVDAGTASINGTIQNCKAQNGGGIYVAKGATANMASGSIIGNTAVNGGGAYLAAGDQTGQTDTHNGGKLIISGSAKIGGAEEGQGNEATGDGGGVYVAQAATITMNGSDAKVQYNNADNGGGVYVASQWSASSLAGSINNNKATNGGGIYLNQCYRTTFGSATIDYNTADTNGGGIYAEKYSGLILDDENVSVSYNQSGKFGGGVYLDKSTLTITNGKVSYNHCDAPDAGKQVCGGAIYMRGSSTSKLEMTGGEVSHNYLQIKNSEDASTDQYSRGAGIYIEGNENYINEIKGGIISSNHFKMKGDNLQGGGIYLTNSSGKSTRLQITNCKIYQNKAAKGGGIVANGDVTLDIVENSSSVTFQENEATKTGGAIWVSSSGTKDGDGNYPPAPTLRLNGITFDGNKVTEGGGGAIDIFRFDESSIVNCTFKDNWSRYDGGAINIESSFALQLALPVSGSTFTGNKAGYDADNNTSTPDRGSAICISQPDGSTSVLHTVVLSGTNSFAQDQSVCLRRNAALTKGSADMAFTDGASTPETVKLDVYPEDLFDGRDILVSGLASASEAAALRGLNAGITLNEGGAEVTGDDLQKLNVVAPHYRTVHNTSDNVIELLKNYLLTIQCTGLQANESAAYRVKDGLNGGGNTLYNVILTGDGTSDPVSKTIEIDYESPKAKSVTSTWEWTYNHAETETPSNTQEVTFDTETKEATCSFTVAKKTEKLHPHGEATITFGQSSSNE